MTGQDSVLTSAYLPYLPLRHKQSNTDTPIAETETDVDAEMED